ncbi:hypothetical protein GGR58DRAFT_498235 [Xylaria digitata]|nr:hypothetical protein GGR58DRAFT_498235 [Xylaria digitata]
MRVIITGVAGPIGLVQHDDFSNYPPETIENLAGAEACIWAVEPRPFVFPDSSSARLLCMEHPFNAAVAFVENLAPVVPCDRKFRFVLLNGTAAERFNYMHPLYSRRVRRIKKRGEELLFRVQNRNPARLSVRVARPPRVLDTQGSLLKSMAVRFRGFMAVQKVAQSLVLLATENYAAQIFDEADLIDIVNQHQP